MTSVYQPGESKAKRTTTFVFTQLISPPLIQQANFLSDALYYALYGARGIFYAIMAIIDPSLIRAIRIWRGYNTDSSNNSQSLTSFHETSGPDKGGIKVQTEIRFEEFELDQRMPSNPDLETTTTLASAEDHSSGYDGSHFNKAVQTKVVGGNDNDIDGPLHTHWAAAGASSDISVDSKAYEQDREEDTSSIADLRVVQEDRIEEIRGTQKARARERRVAEQAMKRQI